MVLCKLGQVIIRADASAEIGTGHLKRCLNLAYALSEQGIDVQIATRRLDSVGPKVLNGEPFPVIWLEPPNLGESSAFEACETPAYGKFNWSFDLMEFVDKLQDFTVDWVVVDHYGLDARWHEHAAKQLKCRILVIDDIADRPISADILLDQNYCQNHRQKYQAKIQREPYWLVGPKFALLSPAYRNATRCVAGNEVRRIGIFLGGTDVGGLTGQIISICQDLVHFEGEIEAVSTSANPHIARLKEQVTGRSGVTLTIDEPNLCAFFSRHDLQIGAGGGATWERICIGAPTLALVLTENQMASVLPLETLGVLSVTTLNNLATVLRELICNSGKRKKQLESGKHLVDGRGATRVALSLSSERLVLRRATSADVNLLYQWRNHPLVRSMSGSTQEISYDEHLQWANVVLKSNDRWLFVGEIGNVPVGSLRFDTCNLVSFTVSIYLDPELIGLGIGSKMLQNGEWQIAQIFKQPFEILAFVSSMNSASRRMFLKRGYEEIGPMSFRKRIETLI